MADDGWKTVRVRQSLYERIEALAKPAQRSVANYAESLMEAALVRQAGRTPVAMGSLRDAIAQAEELGADRALTILRLAVEREAS